MKMRADEFLQIQKHSEARIQALQEELAQTRETLNSWRNRAEDLELEEALNIWKDRVNELELKLKSLENP